MASTLAQATVANFSVSAGTTIAKAYGSNVTSGNLLVAVVGWASSTQTCTVSGSLNGAFTAIATSLGTNATQPFRAETFWKVATSSGAETITATISGSNGQREIEIFEIAGAAAAGHPDAGGTGTGNSSNPTGSITTVAQPGIIISYAMSAAGTITAGSGYTGDVAQNGDLAQHKSYSATGVTSVPYVDASSGQWVVTAASFLDAAGGGGVTVKKLAAQGVG